MLAKAAEFFKKLDSKSMDQLNVFIFGKIVAYNQIENTADVIPQSNSLSGELPILSDVPILFFSSGGIKINSSVNVGDVVMLFFMDYDSDNFVLDGTTIENNTDRTHALDDAFALPFSFNPVNNSFGFNGAFELSGHGAKIEIQSDGTVNINTPTTFNINSSLGTHTF